MMKNRNRLLSFILVLTLCFSSFVFTAQAAESNSSNNNVGDYIDENIELFTPNAHYTELNDASAKEKFAALQADGSENLAKDPPTYANQVKESSNDFKTYLVEPIDAAYDSYIMIVPTEDCAERGSMKEYSTLVENGNPVKSHLYFSTNCAEVVTYNENNPSYYVFEMDVATESTILPVFFEVILRNHNGVQVDGSTVNGWGESWSPQNVANSLYMTMTPGVFHHMTFVGDLDNNMLYVYMDNQLVATQGNLTNPTLHEQYKTSGAPIRIDGMRIQLNSSIAINENMSFCMKDAHERVLTGAESDNLVDYIGKPTLKGWTGNRYEDHSIGQLPPIISVNNVEYNNTVSASHALDAYSTGNVAKLLRPIYSGDITVDCDATIYTYAQEVSLVPGEHTALTKVDGSIYKATLHSLKHSNSLVQSNSANGLLGYLKYNLEGNLIDKISLVNAGATNGVNADVMLTNKGNYYMYAYDNSGAAGDYPDNTHFYMDVEIPHKKVNAIEGHDFIVFDFDIFADTELINVYNGFQPRSLSNNENLGSARFDLTSNLDGTITEDRYIQVESGIWNHFTFVGEVSTGKAFVYINNKLVKTINNGLYNYGTDDSGNPVAVKNGVKYPLSDVTINSFRCMQVYGNGDSSGTTLTPNMSLGADNFDARFVDGDHTLVAGMETLDTWVTNLYGNGYQFDALPPIATIDGVDYYDTLSISEALNDTNYTTTKKEVLFSRDFVGTVTVNCRAEVHTHGVQGNIIYSDRVHTTTTQDSFGKDVVEVYYVQTEDKTVTNTVTTLLYDSELADNGSLILNAIKRGDNDNLYSGHSISSASASYLTWQLYDGSGNAIAEANYNKYLMDKAAQTHTLNVNSDVSSTYTLNSASASNKSTFSSNTTVNLSATEVQYYLITEFDIAYNSDDSTASSLTVNLSTGSKTLVSDLKSLLSGASIQKNEFAHVTVIACIDVVPTYTITTGSTGSGFSKQTTYTISLTGVTYNLSCHVYVNNAYVTNSNLGTISTTSNAKITWNNVAISSNNISIDNLFIGKASETINTTVRNKSLNANNNVTTANFYNNVVNNTSNATIADAGDTTADDAFETTSGSITADGYVYDTAKNLPLDFEEAKTEDVTVDVKTPIASVNGVPYYAADEAELREILANADGDTEVLEVMILREPDTAYTIGANAIVDTNGLSSNIVSYDSSKEFSTTTVGGVTTIIVIGQTKLLATLNETDYYNTRDLQTALSLAKSAELEFYSQPDTALKITCPAVIATNGLTNLYTIDEYVYMTSESNGVVTISKQTATPTIRLIVSGIEMINDAVTYGTDIEEYLRNHGVTSAAVGVAGDIYTGLTYTSTVAEYLTDGKPAGRITEDVTFNVSYSTKWEEKFIVVNNDGSIANLATYDTATLLSYLRNSNTESIILGEDLTISSTDNHSMATNGNISLYLNGYTLTYDAPTGNTASHLWTLGGSANYNFYGPGTIESTTMNHTQGLIFSNYGYTGTVKFKDLTINVSHYLAQLRGGNAEFIGCDINAFIPTTVGNKSIAVKSLFTLGEDYNGNYSTNDISLILTECDVDFRYYDIASRYSNRNLDIPLIHNTIVTTASEENRKPVTVLIDNSDVTLQGSLVNSYETNGGNAPEASTLKLWINESSIMAKGITSHDIKAQTVRFYENVRTNVKNVTAVSFVSTLIKTQSSDGLLPYLYTSKDYATVNWSDGTTEYWAAGSLPINNNCKFDNIDIVEAGRTYTFTSTANSAPFKLYANLTLADVIGFNLYIPATTNVSTVYLDGKLVEKGVTSSGSNTTTVGSVGECYFYSISLAPQEAAKQFTLLIELADGTHVSRKLSVGKYATALYNSIQSGDADYATKQSDIISVALNYIEQAALYNGYNLDMSEITTVLNNVGVRTLEEAATTTDTTALASYISSAQLNITGTCAFRFNAAAGVNLNNLEMTFVVDGNEKEYTVSTNGSYVELSLRAYEMAKTITITIDGNTGTYDLYTYYAQVKSAAGYSTSTACYYNQALQLVESLYKYALISDTYLNANPNE